MLCVLPIAYSGFLPRASFGRLITVLSNKTSTKTQILKDVSKSHFGFPYMPLWEILYGRRLLTLQSSLHPPLK